MRCYSNDKFMKCKFCNSSTSNIRNYPLVPPHLFCYDCAAHYYDDKWWSKIEWEKWINEE